MKLKTKLAKFYVKCDDAFYAHGYQYTSEDMQKAYIAGFEKSRELAHFLTNSKCEACRRNLGDGILNLGEADFNEPISS